MDVESLQRVGTWLQSTLSADMQTRQAAEEALRLCEGNAGHVVCLFRLAADASIPADDAIRQAAVINMKNIIGRRWEPRQPPKHLRERGEEALPALTDSDKAAVRDNLCTAIAVSPPVIRSQLGLCLRTIAAADYPERWPALLTTIGSGLVTPEHSQLVGALYSLRILMKNYEFKRDEKRKPLTELVAATFPTLLELAAGILRNAPTVANSEMALLIAKIMWSSMQTALPPWLLQPGNLDPWFETLLGLLEQPLPEPAESHPSDEEEAIKWAPFKVKKRVSSLFHRLIQRYGNPTRKIEGPDANELLAFARHFQDSLSSRCLNAMLAMLGRQHAGHILPGRVSMLCLQYIEESIKYKLTYAMLKPQLVQLFSEVVLPTLSFSQSDADLWEEDPHEFVRKEYDMIEDFYSPRTAAQNLLQAMTKNRPKDCLNGIVVTCSQVLERSQTSPDAASLRAKDGALYAVGALHSRLAKKDIYRASLEPMLKMYVQPDFGSPHGFLRMRSCWVYGQFAKSIFRPDKSSAQPSEHVQAAFLALLDRMQDPDLPVRVTAALSINSFIEFRCCPQVVLGVLPRLLELLFDLLRDVGIDEVVSTLDTLIEHFGEQMAPYAVQVVTALATNFLRLIDENDEDEDNAAMAAMGIVQAVTTMMEALTEHPEVYVSVEEPLLPMIERVCKHDGEDYLDEMLEVLSYLTYYQSSISDRLWSVLPMIHEAFQVWAKDYLNQMLPPLDNFIHRGTEAFLTRENGGYVRMVVQMIQGGLVSEEAYSYPETDVSGAVKLIDSLLHNCHGRIDALLYELVSIILMRLRNENQPVETNALRILLYTALGSAFHYNATLTMQILDHRQETVSVLTSWVGHLRETLTLRAHDLKVALLAVASILAMPNSSAPQLVSTNRLLLVRQGVDLNRRLAKAREAAKAKEDDENSNVQLWNVGQWLESLSLHAVIASAFSDLPEAGKKQYNYVRRLERERLSEMLSKADLVNKVIDVIMEGAEAFGGGKLQDGAVKSDKFQTNAKFQMTYGSLSLFYGGLESLLGPPKMYKGSLIGAMEREHCAEVDSEVDFTTTNGITSTTKIEWEVVYSPTKVDIDGAKKYSYPERKAYKDLHPHWCREIVPLEKMEYRMEELANSKLRNDGHSELIREELVGGRLYTGPCYAKYNSVLRAKSFNEELVKEMERLTLGNSYTTTIHAINSCVLKLSKLTKAGKVWRGIKDARLPKSFWIPNSMGVRGGIEYGFSSTTTDKEQAVYYAGGEAKKDGDASTVFEMQMGMVDRGADFSWLSQYPHEKEVLLPPLTGLEALETNVDGGMLVIHARLSLNMAAHTLEQVLSRRRKMLMDMCNGIELEVRDVFGKEPKVATYAIKVLNHALQFGPLSRDTEWFNNDDNFANVMSSTLSLQHVLMREVHKLSLHAEKPEISFESWADTAASRIHVLAGWVHARTSPSEVFIDLRNARLTAEDGIDLAAALDKIPTLTSVDVRGNPGLAGAGVQALIKALKAEQPGHPRSLCGVMASNTRLEVPRKFEDGCDVDIEIVVAELESHLYSESVTAGMGGKASGNVIQLNRRGGGGGEKAGWQPLIWAAKVDHLQIGEQMLKNGTDVNEKEFASSHSNQYTPLHMACYKGHLEFVQMLMKWGADPSKTDVNGKTPKSIAEMKGFSAIVEVLDNAAATKAK